MTGLGTEATILTRVFKQVGTKDGVPELEEGIAYWVIPPRIDEAVWLVDDDRLWKVAMVFHNLPEAEVGVHLKLAREEST